MTQDDHASSGNRSGANASVGSSVLLSVAGHISLFAALLFGQHFSSDPPFDPSVLNVTMVTLQSPGPPPPLEEPGETGPAPEEPSPEPVPEPEPPPKPESEKAVVIEKPKPKPEKKAPVKKKKTYQAKRSLKEKTYKPPSKVVRQAIDRLEKNLDETEPDRLQSALDRLRKKVESAPQPKAETPPKPMSPGSTTGVPGGTGSEGGKRAELIDLYRVEIAMQIQQNWAFSEQMARLGPNLKASLVFKVMPNGEIEDVFFTDRSGNRYLDESAFKAIMKSNPVKPHPPGLLSPYVSVGLRFTPEGIR